MLACMPFAALAETPPAQSAQASGMEALQTLTDLGEGFDAISFAQRLLSGQVPIGFDGLTELLNELLENTRPAFTALLGRLALPVGLMLALKLLFGRGGAGLRAPDLLCRLCVMAILTAWFAEAREVAAELVSSMAAASNSVTPVLTILAALGGTPSLSGALTPFSAMVSDLLQGWLGKWGIELCSLAAMLALIGGLSPDYPLKSAFDLTKRLQHWLLGATLFVFTALLTAQGTMASARDGLAERAVKGAIEGAIPIIGGELSDVTGAIAGSAPAVRSAIGITGIVALGRMCLGPVLKLLAQLLALKLAGAILEPATDAQCAKLLERFGETLEMLLAACAICSALGMLLIGSCFVFAGNILG